MPGIKDWLRKASGDLKLASKAVGDDEVLDPAVYLTHQCVEKALKAFFVLFGKAIPRTHDLEVLLYDCAKIDQEFLLLQNECGFLSPYGFDSRYPNDAFYVDQKDLADAIGKATKVLNFVKNKIR